MRQTRSVPTVLVAALLLSAAVPTAGQTPREPLLTRYELIIGIPDKESEQGAGPTITQGAVLFAQDEVSPRDLLLLKEKLKQTYRLSSVYTTAVAVKELAVGEPAVMPTAPSELAVVLTLEDYDETSVTYLVRLEAESQLLAFPKIVVKPGGRAIVASRDGARAPYAFIVIEARPALPQPKKGDGITEPQIVEKVNPLYPEEARKAKVMGAVVLSLTIGSDGAVKGVTVLQAQPSGLTEAAIEAVKKWRYEPARNAAGRPVEVLVTVTITFRLQ